MQTLSDRTLRWVRHVVVGLNLCPFAEKPMREKKLSIKIVHDEDQILPVSLEEMMRLAESSGTALIVCPECHSDDFVSFLVVEHQVQELIARNNLEGIIQVAPFHPLFRFEGSKESDPDNYTNRSPYPTFHILREEEVTNAVDKLDGDAATVWMRNVDLLQSLQTGLGDKDFQMVMQPAEDASGLEIQSPSNFAALSHSPGARTRQNSRILRGGYVDKPWEDIGLLLVPGTDVGLFCGFGQ